ncbi:flagellar biosynthesis protein FlhF [Effusibacillus pohliae]|uniref:flagellar biosynthesis protein FlhF n=1 Tax=Effusibacillus pohliae TaxID=232270 RepID=UPI00037154B4|nr:flagellar biosynthesis protein FlhF [Effusibacillus pohliae]
MIVKRYVVKDMPEALAKIRQDLGHDAVILSSKKIRQRGWLGLFFTTQLEVVAAVNDAPPVAPQKRKAAEANGQSPQVDKKHVVGGHMPVQHPIAGHTVAGANPPHPAAPSLLLNGRQAAGGESEILQEVQELRMILGKFLQQNSGLLPAPLEKIRSELLANDVSSEFAERLIFNLLKENDPVDRLPEQEFRRHLTKLISKEFNDGLLPAPLSPASRVVAFVGPTGVGKTTTIAKIAAEELLKNKRKVGFITTDTFRIAAVDQLKTYANILQIPVEVVFSAGEIGQAIGRLQDRDLILIDTAGRNYGDPAWVEQLNELLNAAQPDETCLVLSLTTKAVDLEQIVGNFQAVEIDKFIFTKLDETQSYGAIYNLTQRYKKPLAYLTTGQNVPDDIEVATPERIAGLVAGEKQYV